MLFNKLKIALIAAAAITASNAIALPAPGAPAAVNAPQPPVAPKAPTAPIMASGSSGAAKATEALPSMPDGLTLRQLEVIQRKTAVIKAKKSFREQERQQVEADAQDAPPVPMVRGPNGQMIPANMVPPPPTPQQQMSEYRVLSTTTFGGKSSADIITGGLVKTVKVGDFLGAGRVTNIMEGGGVTVSLTTAAPTIRPASKKGGRRSAHAPTEIKTLIVDLQRAHDTAGAPQFSGLTGNSPIPGIPGMAPGGMGGMPAPRIMPPQMTGMPQGFMQPPMSAFSADATSVPIIGQSSPTPTSSTPGAQ